MAEPAKRPPYIYATVLLLIGLVLLIGGGWLIGLGGSWYYLIAGLMVVGSGAMLWRGRAEGAWLYGVMLAFTLAWSLWEVGFNGWALTARLVAPTVLGLWLLLPHPELRQPQDGWLSRQNGRSVWLLAIACFVVGAGLSLLQKRNPDPMFQAGKTDMPAAGVSATAPEVASGDWLNYGNDAGGKRFSPLSQLNPSNVKDLKVAWSVPLGDDAAGMATGLEVTPLKIGDTVYACNGRNDVFAIDAETGARRWTYLAHNPHGKACRGLAYYKVPNATGVCAARIYTATTDARLIAIDLRTGQQCPGFGDKGSVNLLKGLTSAPRGYYAVTSAPTIVRGKIVLGGWVSDGQYWGEPSGVVRAFDAVTGQFAWAFDMGRPGDTREPAPGQTYTPSTPNSWAPMSADEQLGLVYFPTGNATPDYYGAQRRPFDDQYSSSVVAVDAETGQVRWHFQTTHHDLWDYDVASQPTLIDIPTASGAVEHALVQPTKRGELFLLDRVTGKPLANVVEHQVSTTGKVPTERLSPTQPFSDGMPSFRGPDLRETDMWGVTPIDQMMCRIKFKQARYAGPLTPVGLQYAVVFPGYLGGFDWGGVTVDPDRHLLIANSSRFANYDRLITRAAADQKGLKPVGADANNNDLSRGSAQGNTPYAADVAPFESPIGAPCQAPPYGYLSAIDLTTRKIVWTHPIGTAMDTGPFGWASHLPIAMGQPNEGASVVTRGGVLFIAATADRYIRAFDVTTGKQLWQARLPSGGQATPMTYLSPQSGRQFVVIASSGSMLQAHGGAKNALIAYALPKK